VKTNSYICLYTKLSSYPGDQGVKTGVHLVSAAALAAANLIRVRSERLRSVTTRYRTYLGCGRELPGLELLGYRTPFRNIPEW
jgi:hypothetical protein